MDRSLACALALLCGASRCAVAADAPPHPASTAAAAQPLPAVTVLGNYLNAVGTSDAASQGAVTATLIAARPTLRPAEVLEFVPGLIVSQHSGDGKANQYYLRGFNLDHGTDFATSVAGMPVNMVSHAHGQGYSDLNWLIPELVARIDYKKGPYFADEGDFASAGAARLRLQDGLPRGIASLTAGGNGYARSLLAGSVAWGEGTLLYALEAAHNDGPWDSPSRFHRLNGLLRYSVGSPGNRSALTAMAYSAGWNATDQIPQRAVASGQIGRFGTIDPTDGGQTSRHSLSFETERELADGRFTFNAYAVQSRIDLFSDFTYQFDHPSDLGDPVDGDQFEQAERRRLIGLATSRSWNLTLGGLESTNTVGAQLRQDRLDPVGLYGTHARQRVATTQESRVRETSIGVYAENATQWLPWLRSSAGLRADRYSFDVDSSVPGSGGRRSQGIGSPKLSLIFGPWRKTELFANAGEGFHSNDARGVTAGTDPVPGLVRSKGGELGLRTEIVPGLQSSLALWQLRLGSELVFVGDAGTTEPNRASRRVGLEFNNHWNAGGGWLFDLDMAASRARYTAPDPADPAVGSFIPGAVNQVLSFGATLTEFGPWFGHVQLRYFGPRPLVEDNSQRSKSTTLASARIGYTVSRDLKLALDVFNLFDRQASDIDYFYTSRLRGEPAGGVDDIHFHPVEPRSVRVSLTANF